MSKIESQIEQLTKAIERLIANPVAPIAPVAPVAPVLPIIPQYSGDHDLLVILNTKLEGIVIDVKKLTEKEDSHVTVTDHNLLIKANDLVHSDHETRIRSVETATTRIAIWGSVVLSVLTIVQILLKVFGTT